MRDYLGWYFPAYFPFCLPAIKWAILWLADVFNPATWFPDFMLGLLGFDFWAVTTKMKGQNVRVDGTAGAWDRELIIVSLVLHLVLYMVNVGAWLKPVSQPLIVLTLVTFSGALSAALPAVILGYPSVPVEERR